ncbi:MAG: hypothetical protein ACI9C4_002852, partial [Paraglaciecola sp.]
MPYSRVFNTLIKLSLATRWRTSMADSAVASN